MVASNGVGWPSSVTDADCESGVSQVFFRSCRVMVWSREKCRDRVDLDWARSIGAQTRRVFGGM